MSVTMYRKPCRSIAARQIASGALILWPGSSYPDDWVTSYAGHFAIEAQKAGYTLPAGFLSKWTTYQRAAASSWRYQPQYRYTANDQAYRLFTLALAGSPDKGAMNRMRETADLPSTGEMVPGRSLCHDRAPRGGTEPHRRQKP